MSDKLTQERLKYLLTYNPITGLFHWNFYKGGRCSIEKPITATTKFGYTLIGIDNKRYLAHRLAYLYMEGNMPKFDIDHIDGNPSNNEWKNLRQTSMSSNLCNSKKRVDNTSGIKGLSYCSRFNRWIAYINLNGKRTKKHFLPDEKEEAIAWLTCTRNLLHKEFANHG